MTKRKSVADKLRAAIAQAERRGITRYRIAKESGVTEGTLSQFVNTPDRQLRLDIAEAIADAIGYRIDLTRKANTI